MIMLAQSARIYKSRWNIYRNSSAIILVFQKWKESLDKFVQLIGHIFDFVATISGIEPYVSIGA